MNLAWIDNTTRVCRARAFCVNFLKFLAIHSIFIWNNRINRATLSRLVVKWCINSPICWLVITDEVSLFSGKVGIPLTGLTTPVWLMFRVRPSVHNRCVIELFCGVLLTFTVGVRAFVIGLSQISSFFSLWSYEFEPSDHFILLVKLLLPTKIWCFVWPRITAEVSYGHEFESPQWISLGAMVVYLVCSGLVWSRISVIMGLSVKYSIGQRVCCSFSFSAVFQTIWTIFALCKLGVWH